MKKLLLNIIVIMSVSLGSCVPSYANEPDYNATVYDVIEHEKPDYIENIYSRECVETILYYENENKVMVFKNNKLVSIRDYYE